MPVTFLTLASVIPFFIFLYSVLVTQCGVRFAASAGAAIASEPPTWLAQRRRRRPF